jgi:Kef-type K+ transport system membrane component KefB
MSDTTVDIPPETSAKKFGGYLLMILVAVLGTWAICVWGSNTYPSPSLAVSATQPTTEAVASSALHISDLARLLIALVMVLAVGLLFGQLFKAVGQPAVIGEVFAGIVLGPSFLGQETSALILPPEIAPYLGMIAQLGVILFMFLVGVELNTDLLRKRAHAAMAISHASIVLPFLCGGLLAIPLYSRYAEAHVTFTNFTLFLGVAMSITAFPVLARILADRKLTNSKLGGIALNCAAIDDATAWCLLAIITGIVGAKLDTGFWVLGGTVVYGLVMFFAVKPVLQKFLEKVDNEELNRSAMAVIFLGLLGSALATELIGIHALFGAFVFGGMIPHHSRVAREITNQLQHVVGVLLLPAFFAYVGMRTQIQLVDRWDQWLWCAAIIAVATFGKFGGTLLAARWSGLRWREGALLGTLMNTRGLMELIVLNKGLELGVISPTLFAMLVIMALVTTMMTGPLLSMLSKPEDWQIDNTNGKTTTYCASK